MELNKPFMFFLPPKGSLKNNLPFWTPMHPVRLRCKISEYPDIPAILRLAGRAPQRPKSPTYLFASPEVFEKSFFYSFST
jgi:hypothetical protein